MLVLIAESKTMNHALCDVTASQLADHQPVFQSRADEIMASLSGLSVAQLSSKLGIGPKSAKSMADDIYDFSNSGTGIAAVDAFTGVVFKSFDAPSLDAAERDTMNHRLRIISSLYGWLRPDDIIKPYRLDFTAKAAPGDKPMSAYWRKDVTVRLINEVRESGAREVVNMLPMDASKCIDWKIVKNFARVLVPNFKRQQGDTLATPNATILKTLRGQLLRHIISGNISDGQALRDIVTPDLIYLKDDPYPGHPQFITA